MLKVKSHVILTNSEQRKYPLHCFVTLSSPRFSIQVVAKERYCIFIYLCELQFRRGLYVLVTKFYVYRKYLPYFMSLHYKMFSEHYQVKLLLKPLFSRPLPSHSYKVQACFEQYYSWAPLRIIGRLHLRGLVRAVILFPQVHLPSDQINNRSGGP